MAEILVERKPRRRTGTWLLILLLLIAAGVAIWFLMFRGGEDAQTVQEPAPVTQPLEPGTQPAPEMGPTPQPAP